MAETTSTLYDPFNNDVGEVPSLPGLEDQRFEQELYAAFEDPNFWVVPVLSSIRYSPEDKRLYIHQGQVSPSDIYLGQASRGSNHPGNEHFRRVVNAYFEDYQGYGGEHGKKTTLRNYIVDTLLQDSRFLVPCDAPPDEQQDVQWYYLQTESKAKEKVRAALHDKSYHRR